MFLPPVATFPVPDPADELQIERHDFHAERPLISETREYRAMNDLINMQSGLCPLSLVYLLKSDVSWSRYSSKYSSLWCICSNQICLGLDIRRSYQRRSIDEVWVWGQPKIAFCQSMIRSVKYRSCITPLFTADDYLRVFIICPKKYIYFLSKYQQVVKKS